MKASSTKIDASLRESNEIKQQLLLEYDQFRDICNRAAKLFIGINQNYNLSVAVFTTLYVKSIKANEVFVTIIYCLIKHFIYLAPVSFYGRNFIQKRHTSNWFA